MDKQCFICMQISSTLYHIKIIEFAMYQKGLNPKGYEELLIF